MAPPPPPIRLHDIYSIALTAARIAHRAAYLQASAAATPSTSSSSAFPSSSSVPRAGPSRPWPTQKARKKSPEAPTRSQPEAYKPRQPTPDNLSLPPQAPDGTFTEMKHVNADKPQQEPTEEEKIEARRKLDEALAAYFAPAPEQEDVRPPDRAPSTQDPASAATVEAQSQVHTSPPLEAQKESDSSISPEPELLSGPSLQNPAIDINDPPSPRVTVPPADATPIESAASQSPLPPRLQDAEVPSEEPEHLTDYDVTTEQRTTPMRASKVPSSRLARLMHYGSLGAGLAWGAAGSILTPGGGEKGLEGQTQKRNSSPFMSEGNIKRLVDKLSRMRGAALKLGQFLSIQDSNLLPPEIEAVLLQVQNSANYMPEWQMEKVMAEELGAEWRSHFASFSSTPFAAASIGQVHHGVLSPSHPTHPNLPVAIKVQFPGIRESIESDLGYLKWLLAASALLPKGLFLENTINQMRLELQDECDYEREAEMGRRFAKIFNEGQPAGSFEVPTVIPGLCGKRVLTTEMMKGRPLSHVEGYNERRRNEIATSLLDLALSELFTHRLMQTDPNFSNFLYATSTRKIQLIDFGATREYSKPFMDDWLRLLICAVNEDLPGCKEWSTKVGYLIGTESDEMVDAHVRSMTLLGSPFRRTTPFNFTNQTLTDDIKSEIPLMLAQRKTPPPKETYSLNRKLSGTFLMCSKLKATVDCQKVLSDIVDGYRFEDGGVVRVQDGKLLVEQASRGAGSGSSAFATARGFHTSSKILREVEQAKLLRTQEEAAASSKSAARTATEAIRRRKVRERYGINLGDRWPRSFQASTPSSASQRSDQFDTLSPSPAGSTMSATPTDPSSTTSSTPELNTPLRTPPNPAQRSSSAESPATAIESNTAERRREEQLSKSDKQPIYVRGVLVPRTPDAPGAEDCCMSGCARCVYDLYKEDLEDYQETMAEVRKKLEEMKPPLSEAEWDVQLLGKRSGQEGGGKDDGAKEAEPIEIKGLDPTMKAFLEMERAMKKKQKV